MESGNAEFWTMEDNGRLVGELYIFFHLTDQDFADGETTAYLCAFRIAEELRGKGLGTMLMNRVLERLRETGFLYATIGVEPEETANIRLYRRLGFRETIKMSGTDPCDVDSDFHPLACSEYMLLRKSL
jgi:Acetyltransferases